MSRWYRAYEGTVTDAKLAEVALVAGCSRSVAIAAWHCVLEGAACANNGGTFETSPRRAAAILCEPLAVMEAVFAEFEAIGLINGQSVVAWKRRQYESDNSTERSRRHREAKRNGDATLQQSDATPPETETETYAEKELANANSRACMRRANPADFDLFWQRYPKRIGKQAALKAWQAAHKRGHDTERIMEGLARYDGRWPADAQFIPHPATWLNQGRYDDEPQEQSNVGNMGGRIGQGAGGGKQPLRGSRTMDFLRSVQRELEDERGDEGGDGGVSYSLALPGCG